MLRHGSEVHGMDEMDKIVRLQDRFDEQRQFEVEPPGHPLPNARRFVESEFSHSERDLLLHQGGQFYGWNGSCWPPIDDAELRARLYEWFDVREYLHETADGTQRKPFAPNRYKVADLVDAMKAVSHIALTVSTPSWLSDANHVSLPADEIIACSNGLVHWPSRTIYPHTPIFYAHHAISFEFNPNAKAPARWFEFLSDLWGDDKECIETLQEIFGYMVAGDTRLQKMFLLVGPKRSGKGTIARIMKAMLGAHNVAGPTLAGLGTNFGLSPLIGKPVAIIADARLKASDTSVITERLLSISGEDTLTIDRKYKEPWTGQLSSRFVILSNELPRLSDSSGALASRFIVLTMTRSFYGAENPTLTDELAHELPGIFNWALDGLERLRARGRFVQPSASLEAIRELEDLGSPVGAFIRDECMVGPEFEVPRDQLYRVWQQWSEDHGRRATTAETFGRDLRSVVPGIRSIQPRNSDGSRFRAYAGIGLAQAGTCSRAMYSQQSPPSEGRSSNNNGVAHVPTCASCPKCQGDGCEWCGDTGRNPEVV